MNRSHGIKSWSEVERPREILVLRGSSALSVAELLAIILGTGTRDESAVDLARRLLKDLGGDIASLGRASLNDLQRFKGIGEAKAVNIMAVLEIGRRRRLTTARKRTRITNSKEVYEHFHPVLGDLVHEEFWALYLNRSNQVLSLKKLSEGGFHSTIADPKKIFAVALEERACAIIVAHNHPSGNLEPSSEDTKLTHKLQSIGVVMECPVLDHLIVTSEGYFSYADQGMLTKKE